LKSFRKREEKDDCCFGYRGVRLLINIVALSHSWPEFLKDRTKSLRMIFDLGERVIMMIG
jgi:hypothetical protein